MAESYISELGDKLSHGVENTDGSRVKIIAPKLYTDGNSHPSIATALAGKAASSHTHGNIQNGGTLQTTDVTIANGDKLVVTDSSDSNKVARTSVSFDGSTTTKALTQKGTFESFAKSGDITTAIQALDVASVGGAGKYISAISETDGKISATATTMDTAPTASSTNAVTSGGVKTALDGKLNTSGGAMTGAITRDISSSGGVISDTNLFTVTGSTDGFKVDYGAATSDVGVTKIYTTDDANAKISIGNYNSSYKEAIGITNGSAALSNTPTAPTAAAGTNTTQIATTAFVTTAVSNSNTPNRLYANQLWGGAFRTSLSPFDNYAFKNANCFHGAKPSAVKIEYSTDGGTTWVDYGLTDEQKVAVFSQYGGVSVYCGKNTHIQPGYTGSISGTKDLSNNNIANQRLRITICDSSLANEGTTSSTDRWLYCTLRRIGIYMSTQSAAAGVHCVFEKRTSANFKSGTNTWVTIGDYKIQGDSGWNSIPCENSTSQGGITFGPSDSQIRQIRFTIWSDTLSSSPAASQTGNLLIFQIVAYSELLWYNQEVNPNMGYYGVPYTVSPLTGITNFPKGINGTASVAKAYDTSFTGTDSIKSAFDNKVDYTFLNNSSVIGNNAPAADCKAYWASTSMPNNRVKILYNVPGNEATIFFSRRTNYGSILKYGYADKYIYILRYNNTEWKSDDWEKISAGYADSAGSATKLGSSTLGSGTKPIYLSSGTATECSTYAGGTAVTLNNASKAASTASFYAPTGAGTSGQLLKSSGSGAPTWATANAALVGITVTSTSVSDGTNTFSAPSALPVRIEEIGSSAVNLDNYTASDGYVHYYTWSNGNRGNVSNKPSDAVYTVSAFMCGAGSAGTYVMQIAYQRGTTDVYIRRRSDGSTAWSSWQPFLYTDANVRSAVGIDTSSSSNTYLKKNGTWSTVTADTAVHLAGNYGEWRLWSQDAYDSSKPYVLLGTINRRMNTNWSLSPLLKFEVSFDKYAIVKLNLHFRNLGTSEGTATQANAEANVDTANIIVVESVGITPDAVLSRIAPRWKVWSQTVSDSKQWYTELSIFARFTGTWQCVRIRQLDNQSGDNGAENWIGVQWVSGSGSGSMVTESYINGSPYHGFSAQSTGYFAGTANVASIALQTSVKNGTYGTTGYYETFAGYDGSNAKVAVADRYNNTNRGTEITPGGVTTTGSVVVGGNIVCNGTLAATNVGQYLITYVPNGTISSSDWTDIKNAYQNGKQVMCIVGGQIYNSANKYEKRVLLDYVVTNSNNAILKFVFTTVFDAMLIGAEGIGYVTSYTLSSSGWSISGGYPAIATAAVTAQNAIKWDGHGLSLNAIDQTPGTISLV
jgi:hypothetical protein